MSSDFDPHSEGISKLKDMLLGRRAKRLSKPMGLHPEDGSTEGDLEAKKKLDDTADDVGSPEDAEADDDEAGETEHPLMKDVMAKLNKLLPPRK